MSEIEKNPYISLVDLAQLSGLTINQLKIILENLKEKNVITRVGSNKKGYWEIIQKEIHSLSKNHTKTTQKPHKNHTKTTQKSQAVLSEIEKNPHISLVDLVQLSGLTINQLRTILENLKDENIITRMGSNRSGYWVIIQNDKE